MPAKSKFKAVVIGVGNEFRGDDGVGIYVAKKLQEMRIQGLKVMKGQDGSNLMDLWQGSDVAILIDAVASGNEPGSIFRYDTRTEPIPSDFFHISSTHSLSVDGYIELSKSLDEYPPTLIVYGIEGKTFESTNEKSLEVEEAAYKVIVQVIRDLEKLFPSPLKRLS